VPLYSDLFINFDFFGRTVVSATFRSTNAAFEFDNLAVVHASGPMLVAGPVQGDATAIPVGGAAAWLGLATALLLARRRARA
jgi:uncharacterized protein (TIGR03382 family)